MKLVNGERERKGLARVRFSTDLSSLARSHSRDMAESARLSHRSSNGSDLSTRFRSRGLYFLSAGENVAFSETNEADFIHESLMESQAHRENLLERNYDHTGIGVVLVPGKEYFVTRDFIQKLPGLLGHPDLLTR